MLQKRGTAVSSLVSKRVHNMWLSVTDIWACVVSTSSSVPCCWEGLISYISTVLKNTRTPLMILASAWVSVQQLARDWTTGEGRSSSRGNVKNFHFFHIAQRGSGVHQASYPMATGRCFPGGKLAGAWNRPLTSNYCRGQENLGLYIHSRSV
jgi:hypothetical protein